MYCGIRQPSTISWVDSPEGVVFKGMADIPRFAENQPKIDFCVPLNLAYIYKDIKSTNRDFQVLEVLAFQGNFDLSTHHVTEFEFSLSRAKTRIGDKWGLLATMPQPAVLYAPIIIMMQSWNQFVIDIHAVRSETAHSWFHVLLIWVRSPNSKPKTFYKKKRGPTSYKLRYNIHWHHQLLYSQIMR